jgi:hypothetical protein
MEWQAGLGELMTQAVQITTSAKAEACVKVELSRAAAEAKQLATERARLEASRLKLRGMAAALILEGADPGAALPQRWSESDAAPWREQARADREGLLAEAALLDCSIRTRTEAPRVDLQSNAGRKTVGGAVAAERMDDRSLALLWLTADRDFVEVGESARGPLAVLIERGLVLCEPAPFRRLKVTISGAGRATLEGRPRPAYGASHLSVKPKDGLEKERANEQ